MTIKAFESASNNSIHFYSEPSLATSANANVISTIYSSELIRPDRKVFTSLFAPKTPVAKLNLRNRTAITFSTDLIRTSDTQTLFDYRGGSIDNEPTTVRINLLTFSEQFNNAIWQKTSPVTITANYDVAPDGTMTADRFVSTGGAFPQIIQWYQAIPGNSYTFSIWVKSDGTTQTQQTILLEGVNLTNFTPTTTWTRVSVTVASSLGGTRGVVLATNSATASACSYLIWGAQLEIARTPGPYQTIGASYTPLEHLITTQDPGAHRRNRITNTELLSAGTWAPWQSTVSQVSGNTWRLRPLATLERHYLYYGTNNIGFQTFSVELKADGYSFALVEISDLLNNFPHAIINLTNGSVTNPSSTLISATSQPLGDGWYRLILSWNTERTDAQSRAFAIFMTTGTTVGDQTYTGNTSQGILIRKPQVERGPVATEYERIDASFFPTETAVTTVPVASVAPRINLLTQTENLNNTSTWLTNGSPAITANTALAPNGTLSAERIDTSLATNGIFITGSVTSLVPHTFSVYVKDLNANSVLRIGSDNRPLLGFITLNANTGQITSNAANAVSWSSSPASNGWYRVSVTSTPTSLVTGPNYVIYSGATSNTSFLAWGAQLEVGNVATSYQRVDSSFVFSENIPDAANTSPTITTQDPGAHRRNLLINTEVASGWTNSQFVTTTDQGQITTTRGTTAFVRGTANGTTDPFIGKNASTGLIAGKTYTWSVVAWTDGGQPTSATLFMYGFPTTEQVKSTSITLTTTPTLYTLTGTFTSAAVSTQLTCRLDLFETAANGNYIYAAAPQLEQGSVVTGYERIAASFFPTEEAVTTSNVTVVAPRRNLLVGTQDFNNPNYWSTQNGTTITGNTTVAPDGTLTADTALSGAGQSSSGFSQARSLALVPHTASIWLRAGNTTTGNFGVWNLSNSVWNTATAFMISGPGTITGTGLMSVSGLSANAWSRVGLTFTPTVASNGFYFYPETTVNATGKTVRVWGAQLETGNVATNYQRVDAALTLAENIPDAANTNPTITTQDPGAHRRNKFINTELLTGSGWTPQNVTVSQVSGNIWRIVPTATTGLHYFVGSTTGADIHTLTWEVKAAGLTAVYFEIYNNLGVAGVTGVNLTTGAVLSSSGGITTTVTPLADGWYRISSTRDLLPGTGTVFFTVYPNVYGSYAANGVDGILVRNPQLEVGPIATEYERIDGSFFHTEHMTGSANANISYSTGSVRSSLSSLTVTPASVVSARPENRERILVQSSGNKLDMYIINQGQIVEYRSNTISISNSTSIVVGASNAGIRVFANGIQALSNTTSIAFFYNTVGNTTVKSQYLPSSTIDNLDRKISFSSGLNGTANTVTLYYTGD